MRVLEKGRISASKTFSSMGDTVQHRVERGSSDGRIGGNYRRKGVEVVRLENFDRLQTFHFQT